MWSRRRYRFEMGPRRVMVRHKRHAWLALKVTLCTSLQTRALKSCDGQQGKGHVQGCNASHVALRAREHASSSRAHDGVASMVQHVSGY